MVLEKTLESPLDCKEIQPVHPKGDQCWAFIGRTDAEAETPILWPPDAKSWFIGKDPDAGRDWGQEEKGMTEDKMAGWHHRLDGHEFGWTPGVGDGQGGLVCCNSWGRKESDKTEWLNWTELNILPVLRTSDWDLKCHILISKDSSSVRMYFIRKSATETISPEDHYSYQTKCSVSHCWEIQLMDLWANQMKVVTRTKMSFQNKRITIILPYYSESCLPYRRFHAK